MFKLWTKIVVITIKFIINLFTAECQLSPEATCTKIVACFSKQQFVKMFDNKEKSYLRKRNKRLTGDFENNAFVIFLQ